ncbi:MAG: ribonucleotide-diphosphate reductase subunit beta [Solirubrobacteraceae bacterium]
MAAAKAPAHEEAENLNKFHFTREMMRGSTYRKYEKAINAIWNPRDLDYSEDVQDWATLPQHRRDALLGLTVRFFAGEQAVAENLVPMIEAAQALDRFDWLMFLSTFVMEECKHAEFFAQWHERVPGILEPEELAPYFLERAATVDPSGRFELPEVVHDGIPRYARELTAAVDTEDRQMIERTFLRFLTLYNAHVEGVLTMPSYEIVVDACTAWDVLPALKQGYRRILSDEGRHITFGTSAVRMLLDEHPEWAQLVHDVFDEFRGTVVGLVEYQKAIPELDLQKYQVGKVRHYRNRCREMGVTPDETLIQQILDPSIDFVVGVTAG